MRRFLLIATALVTLAGCSGSQKPVLNPDRPALQWSGVTPLKGTKDATINGAFVAHYFADGTYNAMAQLNIAAAPKGKNYSVWVREGTNEPVLLGEMASIASDSRHALKAIFKQDLRKASTVQVTLQNDKNKVFSNDIQAEGTVSAVAAPR